LKGWRHYQDRLGSTMAHGNVGQVEQRRPVRRSRVDDFEHGLEVAIEIDRRTRVALKGEWLIAVVPPSVRNPARKAHSAARPDRQPLTIDVR